MKKMTQEEVREQVFRVAQELKDNPKCDMTDAEIDAQVARMLEEPELLTALCNRLPR